MILAKRVPYLSALVDASIEALYKCTVHFHFQRQVPKRLTASYTSFYHIVSQSCQYTFASAAFSLDNNANWREQCSCRSLIIHAAPCGREPWQASDNTHRTNTNPLQIVDVLYEEHTRTHQSSALITETKLISQTTLT